MKKIESFVAKKEQEIAAAYKSVTAHAEYIAFLEAAVKDYYETGMEKFYSTFEEFGQTFTSEYDAAGILTGMAACSYWQAAVGFAANPDQQGYNRLLNALHYNIQALLKCEEQGKIEESIFSTDIALYIILATIYFPKDVAPLLQYFSFYVKTKKELMDAPLYADLLGKADVIPLMMFVTASSGVQLPDDHIKQYVHADIAPAYRKAMDQLYSEDPVVVTAWINEMANDHIAKSKDNWTLAFNHLTWQYFPVEIIALLVMRARKGLSNDFIDNPLLHHFKPFMVP
ncbi:hypothetical protein [Chitinophaga sp.]|uniref:hypothetical protein n=1 Tax=Chitinophaga sp. TaxID=1869181 RepID=UPI002CDE78C5|nr:hypothetical protein [Chitinophaga sp.]HWV67722.1 hypothetical protein [Chitinophaga sp.]